MLFLKVLGLLIGLWVVSRVFYLIFINPHRHNPKW
jgi:hypothetical protein